MTTWDTGEVVPHQNMVYLVGRLSRDAVVRTMSSGAKLTTWRLVIRRDFLPHMSNSKSPPIDVIDCGTWMNDISELIQQCEPGDHVEVNGWLRRRFWQSTTGKGNRCEVEVHTARRLSAACSVGPAVAAPDAKLLSDGPGLRRRCVRPEGSCRTVPSFRRPHGALACPSRRGRHAVLAVDAGC